MLTPTTTDTAITDNEQTGEAMRERLTVTPRVDVYESDAELLLVADLPGVRKEDIELNLEDGVLTVFAKRQLEAPGSVLGDELGDHDYQRSFRLPRGLDFEKVSAECAQGSVKIHLPKAKAFQPRQIAITGA